MDRLILASASPRRRELMTLAGLNFEVCPAVGEEAAHCARPCDTVRKLAAQKAREVAGKYADATVIGADTVVVLDGEIIGKPRDGANARAILHRLSGRTHYVYTGVCVVVRRGGRTVAEKLFFEKTAVEMYPVGGEEIDRYVASGEPMDKAGAYAVQGGAITFVKRISGDYSTVVGLPVARLCRLLNALDADGSEE